jgi:hypothetical protein
MNRTFAFALAAAAALSATVPAFANNQLVASAGLTAAEAEGLTLTQISATKTNRGLSVSDRQAVVIVPGDAGISAADLKAKAIDLFNRGESFSDRQPIVRGGDTVVSSRAPVDPDRHAQLIASAGLSADEARGLTLNQIAAFKANRGLSVSDFQKTTDIN